MVKHVEKLMFHDGEKKTLAIEALLAHGGFFNSVNFYWYLSQIYNLPKARVYKDLPVRYHKAS